MASPTKSKTKFEPIVIEIDGKTVEICACGQTKNEDRTCDGTHNELNAQMENESDETVAVTSEKTMTLEEVLDLLNKQGGCCGGHNHNHKDDHVCACGGSCNH